jgi:hypothetical protein
MDNEVGGGDVVFMFQLLQSGERSGIVLCCCGNKMLVAGWDFVKVGFNFGFVVVFGILKFFLGISAILWDNICVFKILGIYTRGIWWKMKTYLAKCNINFSFEKVSYFFQR